ncbi:MAG: hypothetical protein AAGJ52_10570, partial [Pseudomonadota bacterium]
MTFRLFLLTLLAAMMLIGCGGSDDSEGAAANTMSASDGGNPLFERIDADTVMIGANLQRVPEDLVDQLWQPLESMGEYNEMTYKQIAEDAEERSPVIAALMREVATIDSRESVEALGISSNGYWAMHMVSIYPVLHLELSDRDAFVAMLDRVQSESDAPAPTRMVGDQEILWMADQGFGVALHHDERFLTVAMVPDNEGILRRVANVEGPTQAFEASNLADFNGDRGYVGNGSGYMDIRAFFNQLVDTADPLSQPAREILEMGNFLNDTVCRAELDVVFDYFPKMVFGLTTLDTSQMDMEVVVETNADLAGQLAAIADTPVGLSGGETETMSMGVALDLVAARNFARDLVGSWVATPPQCALFADIAANAADWQRALNTPIPPVVTNIRGFRVNIDNFAIDENGQPADLAGNVALFVRNPQMLLGMAQMFSPEVAEMGVEPNGEPKQLPAGLIPNMPDMGAYVALSDEAIGMSVGEGQQANLPAALVSNEADGAIMAYNINFEGYSRLMSTMIERINAVQGMDESMPPPDFMADFAEYYDTGSFAIRMTDRGIVFES